MPGAPDSHSSLPGQRNNHCGVLTLDFIKMNKLAVFIDTKSYKSVSTKHIDGITFATLILRLQLVGSWRSLDWVKIILQLDKLFLCYLLHAVDSEPLQMALSSSIRDYAIII